LGEADAAVLFGGGPWDLAGPAVIVTEAGGRFTDLDGNANLDSGGGLFTNGQFHDILVQRF
jgi:histidinol-phosphatase